MNKKSKSCRRWTEHIKNDLLSLSKELMSESSESGKYKFQFSH
jgi:hypothetical protein